MTPSSILVGEPTAGSSRIIRPGDPEEPPRDFARSDGGWENLFERLRGPMGILAVALLGLLVLASLYTLLLAREILVPVVAATLLNFLLTPLVRFLSRLGLPNFLAAALVVLGLLGGLGLAVYRLAEPTKSWIASAPETLERAERRIRDVLRPVDAVREAVDQIGGAEGEGTAEVTIQGSSLSSRLMNQLGARAIGAAASLFLLFFLLASGDHFLRKIVGCLPLFRTRRRVVQASRRIERDLSTYLLTTTAINAVLGLAVGITMWRLGMPNPTLWGVAAALLNFIPYVGGLVGVALIGLVAVVSFDSLAAAVVPPLAYLALNTLEAYVLTPAVMGRRFSMNPVVVFIFIFFLGSIWGVAGALMAVPILVSVAIVCRSFESLYPIAEFLGR